MSQSCTDVVAFAPMLFRSPTRELDYTDTEETETEEEEPQILHVAYYARDATYCAAQYLFGFNFHRY